MCGCTSDESNIGFVLVNLRTKETKFYTVPGATELAAMDSARGQVQHLNYSATFPLLLNISGRPAYFISLKDAAGLVKMYAFVDVSGTVEAIENVVISGNTYYYFTLTDDRTDSIYTAAITVSERLPFVQAGDSVSFECVENGSTKEVITWR